MKRFWTSASLLPTLKGQQLVLDGKPLRLPEGGNLVICHPTLATAIQHEWQHAGTSPGGKVDPHRDLPLTQLHTTAVHRIAPHRQATITALAAYGESDLLCYRAATPKPLRARQHQAWQPWLDWAAETLNAPLCVTESITHVSQPSASLAALTAGVAARNEYELAALGVVVPATGSLVLGLALIEGAITAAQAHAIATIDEAYQTELWGADAEAIARIENIAAEIRLAARFAGLTNKKP